MGKQMGSENGNETEMNQSQNDEMESSSLSGGNDNQVPWGLFATIALTALIIVMYLVVQAVSVFALLGSGLFDTTQQDTRELIKQNATNGALLGWVTLISGIAVSALTVLFIRVKSCSIIDYLALHKVQGREILKWMGLSLVFVTVTDIALNYLINRPFYPDWLIDVWNSGKTSLGLYVGFLLAAPVFEEILFRGFAYRGIAESFAGPWTAIVLTSVSWGFLHSQYDFIDTTYVIACGLLLGLARWLTGSIYTAMAMHAFINLLSIVQVALFHQNVN